MDEEKTPEYETPEVIDYGNLAELTASQVHGDPLNSLHHPEHDPHLVFSG